MITMEKFSKLDKIQLLDQLYCHFQEKEDTKRAAEMLQLYEKISTDKWVIAFCGHFSAGKSTMINGWWGKEILPTSPIPTSGNVVTIQKGNNNIRLWYQDGSGALINEAYTQEKYESLAWDSELIERMDIFSEDTILDESIILMDTPGVDSNDEAHREATMKALFIADYIIYVMDYNHVQSESNFSFVKELLAKGKRMVLIVNQIDKHRENELSFSSFEQSVYDSFKSWGIDNIPVFFTSLKSDYNGRNDFQHVRDFIQTKYENRHNETELQQQLHISISEHIELERNNLSVEPIPDNIAQLENTVAEFNIVKQENKFILEAIAKANDIVENALFMTYETREACKDYLSSYLAGFKKRWFASAAKKEAEKNMQEEIIVSKLRELTDVTMIPHLKLLMNQVIEKANVKEEYNPHSHFITAEWLNNLWNKGAILNNESLLHYTAEIRQNVMRELRAQFVATHSKVENKWNEKYIELELHCKNSLSEIEDYKKRAQHCSKSEDEVKENEVKLRNFVDFGIDYDRECMINKIYEENQKRFQADNVLQLIKNSKNKDEVHSTMKSSRKNNNKISIEQLEEENSRLYGLPLLHSYYNSMRKKIESLKNRSYQVVLFGAFSAGKSSFINAFLQEDILPSSPNPTTAAICKIQAPQPGKKHMDFDIIWKTDDELFLELQSIFELGAINISSLNDAIIQIDKGNCEKLISNHPVQGSFLQAFRKGYKKEVGTIDFRNALILEEVSCFIKEVTLYYDHPYTKRGFVFVDTPGVDSVNGRHTNVAFTYMKEADVILYVTYYNHAFSKSDKEFLLQLGRMKEEFPQDKMFFLVNAIDLAKDDNEQKLVEKYVTNQLENLFIKNPRLFGISSLLELQKESFSGFTAVKNELESFLENELQYQIQEESHRIYEEAVNYAVQVNKDFLESEENKHEMAAKYEKEKSRIIEMLHAKAHYQYGEVIQSELEELLFYVRKRVGTRQQEFFKESFYPGRLTGSYRTCKNELYLALTEFMRDSLFDVEQELRATTFRIENHLQRILSDKIFELKKEVSDISSFYHIKHSDEVTFTSYKIIPYSLAELTEKFQFILRIFRSSKSFFELRENKLMLEELQKYFSQWLNEEFKLLVKEMTIFYENQFSNFYKEILKEEIDHLEEQLDKWMKAFENPSELSLVQKFLEDISV